MHTAYSARASSTWVRWVRRTNQFCEKIRLLFIGADNVKCDQVTPQLVFLLHRLERLISFLPKQEIADLQDAQPATPKDGGSTDPASPKEDGSKAGSTGKYVLYTGLLAVTGFVAYQLFNRD